MLKIKLMILMSLLEVLSMPGVALVMVVQSEYRGAEHTTQRALEMSTIVEKICPPRCVHQSTLESGFFFLRKYNIQLYSLYLSRECKVFQSPPWEKFKVLP